MLERIDQDVTKKRKKRPDLNELAKLATDTATDNVPSETDNPEDATKNQKAVRSGHLEVVCRE